MQREHRQTSRAVRRALALGGALALAFAGSGTAFADTPNPIAQKEWALNYLNATEIRKLGAQGAGVIVAVIDTGVDPQQPDLKGRLVDGVNLVDPSNPTSDYSDQDSESHGTSVATVVAGYPHADSSGSPYGMIGLADKAEIMPIKAGDNGGTSDPAIIAGINYAIAHGAQVINISQGGSISDSLLTSAIDSALAHGIVVVVSAGNNGKTDNASNPIATVPGVLDVGGVDSNGQGYSFSHYGSDVDVAAPANSIEVGLVNGQYTEASGTSLSSPFVAGEAALLIAKHPTWTSGQIVAAIIDNTTEVAGGQSTAGKRIDDHLGYGTIDPVAALQASEPTQTTNPLGGPPITSSPGANVSTSASASAQNTGGSSPTAAAKSSSKAPLIIGIVAGVIVLVGLLIFLLTRGRNNRGGKGGPGGGGGGNGYTAPQTPPGGQYAQPPNYQQQPNPYQQPQPQQPQQYPQQGGYGQQPQNPYQGH